MDTDAQPTSIPSFLAAATDQLATVTADDAGDVPAVYPPYITGAKEQHCWNRQEAFLSAYTKAGNIWQASHIIGINDRTVREWVQSDRHGFQVRIAEARIRHREYLEGLVLEALADAKPRDLLLHPILPIAALNAAWPEKYRRNEVQADETAKEILAELKRMARERRAPGGSMGPPAVVDQQGATVAEPDPPSG